MPQAAAKLGRNRKLLDGGQFKSVFSQKKSIHGKYFGMHVIRNRLNHPRLGMAVSKKVSKKAVQRNRIKRQIRESFRLCQDTLIPMDCVVVSKIGCADQENRVLRTELDGLWSRANKKCENF